ncbi:Uncharacterised protein [Morganella morganii]|uniref:tail fiber/spike domain-containing protein n=1 Tax=Morganella morganii TaxID=582 RepID=UPI000D902AD1|nr:hypothetical protein [Morganella morganii]SPX92956.1 Uncharacterised protein [Morganella morganii]
MATIPTQNAVPSEAPRDLKFNSGKIDEFVTSLEHEYKDRFGRCHMTIEGMRWIFEQLMERFKVDINQAIIAAGYIPMDSFQLGAEITKRNEILRDETTGEYYRWDGDLPKSVPAGSTPESSGGVGMGAWVGVGDASLRSELHGDDGYKLIPSMLKHVQIQQWREQGDIRGWGAIEGEDCSEALQAAIKDRASLGWGTSSCVIIDGSYRVDKKVLIPTDLRLIGNWATITSSLDDFIFESAYVDDNGELVSNLYLSDDEAIAKARLKGTTITGITFVDCAKVMRFRNFNERCGLQDLYFEKCGVAWEMVMSFYSFFNNISIRSVKSGFEDFYSYSMGRQTNLVDMFKVTVSERKYGTYFGDDDPLPNKKNIFYEMVSMRQCSWEHVDFPVTLNMDGYSLKIDKFYAEVVSGPLFRTISGNHYDLRIESPSWLAGVENMAELSNIKGVSVIHQAIQNDHVPPKPASMLLTNSTCKILAASNNGYGNRLNYDSTSIIGIEFPPQEKVNNIVNNEFVTNSLGSVARNISKSNVASVVFGDILLRTKIKNSKHNVLIITINLNNYECGAMFIGEQLIKQYGYTFVIAPDADGNTSINITGTGINSPDDVIITGCVRYL